MRSIDSFWGRKYKKGKGYKLEYGESPYSHRFGGHDWDLPECINCKKEYHQLITLDLSDPQLEFLQMGNKYELPLISCLNCSSWWEYQSYKIDFENKKVELINVVDEFNEILDDEAKFPLVFPERPMCIIPLGKKEIPTTEDLYEEIVDCFGEEYICRVGGNPVFLTGVIMNQCPVCESEMNFVAQIMPAPFEDNKVLNDVDFYFGEGVIYYYYCNKCKTMHVITQA